MNREPAAARVATPSDASGVPFVRVRGATSDQVAEGTLVAAELENGGRLCLGRTDGALFAVKDSCPHREYPLSEGTLYANGELECCWHGATFDCRSGAVIRGPAESPLVRYELEERDGAIWARRIAREG